MSLINQMLKDLQEQKNGNEKKPSRMQPKMVERIPYLPLPVVLGGGALLLLCFVWWMAGALADLMFDYETVKKDEVPQQLVQKEAPPLTPQIVDVTLEEESLTAEERAAEAPQASPDSKRAQVSTAPVKVVAAPPRVAEEARVKEAKKSDVVKATSSAGKKSAASLASAKRVKPVRTVKVTRPAKKPPVMAKTQTVVQAPKRLHPDQLPGAIRSPVNSVSKAKLLEPRPTKAPANTPYGMAEEAYLDGKWALARDRGNLAVLSLQDALELYPGHLQARALLIELLSKDGKTGEAMFLLAEGLEIAPDYMIFKKNYSRMLSDQGDYDAAIKVMLNGGLPPVDKDPEAHVVLASLYQRLGESFLAAQTYRNLLVAWPQTGAFWVGLGSALEGQKLPQDAVECYKRALETKNLRQDLSAFAKKRLALL